MVAGAEAFKRDFPQARVAILDAGHFAVDTRLDDVVSLTEDYMSVNKIKLGNNSGGNLSN